MDKENDTPIPYSHDLFFKELFSDKEKAEDFLKGSLPEEVLKCLDLSSLRLDKDSYVDDELREHFADLLYHCNSITGYGVRIALLFEHKSSVPKVPHLQLLRYMLKIWEGQVKNKGRLTPVIPIIVYHGRKKWEYKRMEAYFEGGQVETALKAFLPDFEYWLTDLRATSPEEIQNSYNLASLKIALKLMKFIFSPNILELLPLIFQEGNALITDEEGKRYYDVLLLYLIKTVDVPPQKINEVMDTLFSMKPPKGTTAWQIQEKGREEGLEKGREEGREEGRIVSSQEIAIRMYMDGFSLDVISRLTDLKIDDIKKILNLG